MKYAYVCLLAAVSAQDSCQYKKTDSSEVKKCALEANCCAKRTAADTTKATEPTAATTAYDAKVLTDDAAFLGYCYPDS